MLFRNPLSDSCATYLGLFLGIVEFLSKQESLKEQRQLKNELLRALTRGALNNEKRVLLVFLESCCDRKTMI
jgi:hypothetical protein